MHRCGSQAGGCDNDDHDDHEDVDDVDDDDHFHDHNDNNKDDDDNDDDDIATCHLPIGDSPQEWVVMKAQFVKPEEEKS